MVNVRNLLSFVSLAIIVAGAVVGLIPVSVGDVSCGSAFFTSSDLRGDDILLCEALAGSANRRVWALAVVALGLVLFFGGLAATEEKGDQ